jgi:hypothetical protein
MHDQGVKNVKVEIFENLAKLFFLSLRLNLLHIFSHDSNTGSRYPSFPFEREFP